MLGKSDFFVENFLVKFHLPHTVASIRTHIFEIFVYDAVDGIAMVANEPFEFILWLNVVLKGKLVFQYSFDLSLSE